MIHVVLMRFINYNSFQIWGYVLIMIFGVFLSGNFALFFFITILVAITTSIFARLKNTNSKQYFIVEILTISAVTFYLNQQGLVNINYILPLLGAIMLILLNVYAFKRADMAGEYIDLIKIGKYEEALDKLNEILKLYPKDYKMMIAKTGVLEKLERFDEQLELSNMLIESKKLDLYSKKEPKNMDVALFNSKIGALLKLKRYDEAEEIIDKMLEKGVQNSGILKHKGSLLAEYGNYNKAIDYYNKAIERRCYNIDKIKNTRNGKHIADLVPLDYGLDKTFIETGKIYIKVKEYDNALSYFNTALKINPNSKEALKTIENLSKI